MQEKQLYEFAVIRVVPRVEREEFVNVGVILFCKKKKFLSALINPNPSKIICLHADADATVIAENLRSLEQIAKGGRHCGPIGQLDAASRFRWLTATRSTMVQTSRIHPGLCDDPEQKLVRLFEEYVSD